MDDVCICTTEPRPRVLHGPNGSRYGDELLDLVGTCHDGAYRGQGQLLGPSNPRLESLMGFKRRGYLCTWSTSVLQVVLVEVVDVSNIKVGLG